MGLLCWAGWWEQWLGAGLEVFALRQPSQFKTSMLSDGASSPFGLFQAPPASPRSQMAFSLVDGNGSVKKPSSPH